MCLVAQIVTKLSHNVYIMNIHTFWHTDILTCQIWLQLMEYPLVLLPILRIFMNDWGLFMSELLYLHQIFTEYVSNQFTRTDILYIDMPNVTASYGMYLDLFQFLCEFCTQLTNIHVWCVVHPPNFYGFSV